MATRLAEAFVEVSAKFKDVEGSAKRESTKAAKQVENELGKKTAVAGEKAGKETSKRFGGALRQGLKGIGGAFAGAVAGTAVVGFFKDAIAGASDLGETTSKVGQIFGESAAEIEKFSKNANQQLGQTRQQAMDAAATFGVFGKAAGLGGKELSDFSTEMVTLSADMASFANTTPDEAIQAIGAALRGESEPIRRYGVLLDDATLRQEALKLGLIDTVKDALTPQQKALAAHRSILAQTSDVQGDFQRTSGGLANQQRILGASWEDMKTSLGQGLLPVVTGFVSFLSGTALPAVKNFGNLVGDIGGTIVDVFDAIPGPVLAVGAGLAGLTLLGPRLAALGTTVATAVAGPFMRFAQQMQVQTSLANNYGRQLTTTGAAMTVFRTRLGGLGGVVAGVGKGFRGLISMLGGPWTVAITATIAGLTYLIARQTAAEKAAEAHQTAFEGLTEALVASKGKYTDTVLEQVIKGLEDASILDNAKHLGIELTRLRDAVAHGGDEFKQFAQNMEDAALTGDKFNGLTKENRRILVAMGDELLKTGGSAEQYSLFIDKLTDDYASNTDATSEQRAQMHLLITEYLDLAGGAKLAREENRKSADSAKLQTEANKGQKDSSEKTTGAIKKQVIELGKLIDKENQRAGVITSSREAQRQYQEAVDAARASIKENGRTLDINSAKGRANQAALDSMASAALNQAAAMEKNGASQETTARKIGKARTEFIKTARQMGLSDKAARKLADQLRLIPGKYEARIHADTGPAKRALDSFLKKYGGKEILFKADMKSWLAKNKNLLPQFAAGGPVPGWMGVRGKDSVAAALMPDEHVVTTREVRGAGGHAAVESQRARWRAGVRGYADGGPVTVTARASTVEASRDTESLIQRMLGAILMGGGGGYSPGLNGALKWARSQVGKPYIWGGVGPAGYDCSGFMSAITNVIRGRNPHSRLGSTATFPWSGFTSGTGPFTIGSVANAGNGIGHMAGTLNNVNVESRGGQGVVVGPSARGASNGLFAIRAALRGFATGGPVDKIRGDPPYDLARTGAGKAVMKTLGVLHDGTDFVPRTGSYLLERGEGVTPRRANTAPAPVVNIDLSNSIIASQRQLEDMLTQAMQRMHDRGRLKFA